MHVTGAVNPKKYPLTWEKTHLRRESSINSVGASDLWRDNPGPLTEPKNLD
jgi:hypothetical protein